MTSPLTSHHTFVAAPPAQRAEGLLGWVSFTILDLLRVDGVAVRRTRGGRITLSFPTRLDRGGAEHAVLNPIDDRARREIEDAVLGELGFTTPEAQP